MKIDFGEIFTKENIENVKNELNEYLPELFVQEKSKENMRKIMQIFEKASSFNNQEYMKLLYKYSDLKYIEKLYEICLAYYIGFQRGAERNK